jgi:predicted nuclease with TOPRIM domain
MEEFKDACWGLDVRSEEIAADLRNLPTDYTLAERYMEIDQEIYEMKEWYERVKKERIEMDKRFKRVDQDLRHFNNDVQRFKLREFSRVRHGGSYSQLPQNQYL